MKNKDIKVSIVIVNYRVEKELLSCISSIINSKPKVQYEIIIVDNDHESRIKAQLGIKFPQVKYRKTPKNIGFGAGNNLGSRFASGEYLFFLNPDTIVEKDSIDTLFNFVKNNSNSGMVAPMLFDLSGKAYPNQGSDEYDLKSAIVMSSFVNKLFPNNPISKKFLHKDWTKKVVGEFDVVPGTAFMIRKDLFEKIGMFDEKLFLYFEEYDLAIRIKKLGYKNYIIPKAKVLHMWEASTKKRIDINKIFAESRYYFFKKNYGGFAAFTVNLFSNIGKYELLFLPILILSIYLGSFRIREMMPFIGDQGWFYLSARDMLVNGQIPLVGIASSHPWLHQGPFWTYLLVPFLWLFNFDPVSGAYLTIIIGFLSVIGIYVLGSTLLSKRAGLIAALLYSASPLTVYYMRFPYHTSPIPLFVLTLIFSLYKIVKEKYEYLPLAIFLLTILYNFEIATVVLWGTLISILIYKLFKSKSYFNQIFNKKNIIYSLFAFTIPLLPMILYDVRNGFPQTLKFVGWTIYRVLSLFGYNPEQSFSIDKIIIMLNFLFNNFTKLIFAQSSLISFAILVFLIVWGIYVFLKKKNFSSYSLILILFFIPFILVLFNQTPSDAYLPIFFPIIILLFSSLIDFIMRKKIMFVLICIFLTILTIGNINFMLKNNFIYDESGKFFTLEKRLQASHEILNVVKNNDYNLIGKGPGSEFESFTMNYEYLTWWLGHAPSKNNKNLKVYVSESMNGIKIESEE